MTRAQHRLAVVQPAPVPVAGQTGGRRRATPTHVRLAREFTARRRAAAGRRPAPDPTQRLLTAVVLGAVLAAAPFLVSAVDHLTHQPVIAVLLWPLLLALTLPLREAMEVPHAP